MAADDIYQVTINLEGPSTPASFSLFYEEVVGRDGPLTDTLTLADAWDTVLASAFLAVLSSDWKYPSLIVRKMVLNPVAMSRIDNAVQVGGTAGPALPANNAILLGLNQGSNPASSNGRVFIPGVAEGVTKTGVLNQAFLDGDLLTFTNLLIAQLVQPSAGTGRWDLGVISAKIRDLALPAKDWEGAFQPVNSITRNPIIATQRRRQTKVRGRSL